MDGSNNKTADSKQSADRDKVKAEREARRLAKVAAKQKNQDKNRDLQDATTTTNDSNKEPIGSKNVVDPAKQPKKQANKQNAAPNPSSAILTPKVDNAVVEKLEQLNISKGIEGAVPVRPDGIEEKEKKVLTKAERRAIQEAQRAAKAAKTSSVNNPVASAGGQASKQKPPQKQPDAKLSSTKVAPSAKENVRKSPPKVISTHRVKLFNHLYTNESKPSDIVNSTKIAPAIIQLGVQYATGVVKGSNARCIAFLNAIKLVGQFSVQIHLGISF